ncbi:MAG: hypothetical protein R3F18_11330, partial [Lysobacterales bacterium]
RRAQYQGRGRIGIWRRVDGFGNAAIPVRQLVVDLLQPPCLGSADPQSGLLETPMYCRAGANALQEFELLVESPIPQDRLGGEGITRFSIGVTIADRSSASEFAQQLGSAVRIG